MVVPFGISIGDFIAVAKLAHDIAAALSDCRGAAAEYKSLIELLRSLKTSVSLISDFVSSSSSCATLSVDQAFVNGLLFHTELCYKLMNQFMVDSRKYTDRMINGRGNKTQITFRKLKWSLYSAEDARKLEQRLTSHLEAFDRYLLAVNIQSTHRLERQVDQVSYTLAEIVKSVQKTQLSVPKCLGYPWEGDAASSHVYLDDVLGRSTVLPAVLCRTFDTFHDTLKIMFSDHPGFETVVKGDFEIIDETNACTIFEGRASTLAHNHRSPIRTWIKPGTKLSMSILSVRTLNAPKNFLVPLETLECCPTCGFHTLGRKFRKCQNCNLSFRTTVLESSGHMPQRKELMDWQEISFPRRITNTPSLSSDKNYAEDTMDETIATIGTASRSADTEMEWKFFQRVHHITEFLVPIQYCANHFRNSRLPLIQAVGQGNIQWVRDLLLHTDTDPDCRSFQGWTALQQACSTTDGNPKAIVELLIANGANVNATPGDGYAMTALQAACEAGNEEVVDILLREGAEINAEAGPVGGKSALAAASWARHFGIVKKLLDLGADINQRGSGDLAHTALSAAAQLGNLELIDYLVQRGADCCGKSGSEALEKAIYWDQIDVAIRLLELGVDVNAEVDGQALIHALSSLEMLNLLIAHGAQVNGLCSRPGGCTALQRAARFGKLDLVKELIRLGADIQTPGPEICGRTALQSASSGYFGNTLPVLKLLIDECGQDVNEARSSEEGYTSLEAACHCAARDQDSELGIVQFLLERGAKVTPFSLHVTAAWGHAPLAQLLLRHGARIEESSDIKIVVKLWGDGRDFGSTVIETAQLNGNQEFVEMLKAWVDTT